jgi:hypothetical protein
MFNDGRIAKRNVVWRKNLLVDRGAAGETKNVALADKITVG